jgi:hypothetical protein
MTDNNYTAFLLQHWSYKWIKLFSNFSYTIENLNHDTEVLEPALKDSLTPSTVEEFTSVGNCEIM